MLMTPNDTAIFFSFLYVGSFCVHHVFSHMITCTDHVINFAKVVNNVLLEYVGMYNTVSESIG